MTDISSQKQDEIDLIELFRVLWTKKHWIVLSAFVCTLIAGIYAFTAKEQWTSKAVVIQPKVANIGAYLSAQNEYASILEIKDFSQEKVVNDLFNNFKTALFSRDIKEAFFNQSKWFQDYSNKATDTEEGKLKLLSALIEKNLIISLPDLKKDPNALGVNVSFAAETPADAKTVLTEYITFVNQIILNDTKEDLIANLNLIENNLQIQKNKIEQNSENIRKIQLENLNVALTTAKSAGIKDYSKSINGNVSVPEVLLGDARVPFTDSKLSDGSYLFMLGEKYLQAQLDTLKTAPLVYPLNYADINKQLSLLNNLETKVEQLDNVSAYAYLSAPDYPVAKDRPKKLLILAVGFVVGIILSLLIILVRSIYFSSSEE